MLHGCTKFIRLSQRKRFDRPHIKMFSIEQSKSQILWVFWCLWRANLTWILNSQDCCAIDNRVFGSLKLYIVDFVRTRLPVPSNLLFWTHSTAFYENWFVITSVFRWCTWLKPGWSWKSSPRHKLQSTPFTRFVLAERLAGVKVEQEKATNRTGVNMHLRSLVRFPLGLRSAWAGPLVSIFRAKAKEKPSFFVMHPLFIRTSRIRLS